MLAEIVGFGMSQDGFDLNRPCDDGAGAELCMRRALDDAGLEPTAIEAVNAHATGTFLGDLAEATSLRRLLGSTWRRTPVSAVKGAIGHAMASAGALETIVAAFTCATGIVPPTVNLVDPMWAASWITSSERLVTLMRALSCLHRSAWVDRTLPSSLREPPPTAEFMGRVVRHGSPCGSYRVRRGYKHGMVHRTTCGLLLLIGLNSRASGARMH